MLGTLLSQVCSLPIIYSSHDKQVHLDPAVVVKKVLPVKPILYNSSSFNKSDIVPPPPPPPEPIYDDLMPTRWFYYLYSKR